MQHKCRIEFTQESQALLGKRTLASNLIKAPSVVRSLKTLSHLVDENKIELVITEFVRFGPGPKCAGLA